jgi:hypothetical protein
LGKCVQIINNLIIVIGRHVGSWHVCSSRYLSVVEGIVFLSVLGFSVQIYGLQLSEVHRYPSIHSSNARSRPENNIQLLRRAHIKLHKLLTSELLLVTVTLV